jgi:hypothetical protein
MLFSVIIFSQNQVIRFQNPSFEGTTKGSEIPVKWENSGSLAESPPDTQPGFYGCDLAPFHGKKYLGMVVRDNVTREAVGQKLKDTLKAGTAYAFDVTLAKSDTYMSSSAITMQKLNYNKPCVLKIWLGDQYRYQLQLIYKSPLIDHSEWKKYHVEFLVKNSCKYVTFELDFKDGSTAYCGNMLIDDLSDIIVVEK